MLMAAWKLFQIMLVLNAQDIVADLSIEYIDNQGSKHEYFLPKIEDPFPAPASLLLISSTEIMRSGIEEYILKKRGSVEIACSTQREDLKVGIGHASNLGTVINGGQISDVAIVAVPATTPSCCLLASNRATEVLYFQDFSPSPISKSALSTLERIQWQTYGMKLKEILVDSDGNAVLRWEDLPLAHIDIAIHSYNIKILPTMQETSERKLVRKAIRTALDDLKAKYSGLLLTSHAQKIQKYAPDLSRCIAGLIGSSNDLEFQGQCASLLGLEARDVGSEMLELRITEKLVEIINTNDMKKEDRDLAPGLFDLGPTYDEDCLEDEGGGYVDLLDA